MRNVIIYSGPNCKYCKEAKAFLEKNGIAYTEYDVTKEPAAKEKLFNMGLRKVPVIDIDGDIVVGFDEKTIADKLGISGK